VSPLPETSTQKGDFDLRIKKAVEETKSKNSTGKTSHVIGELLSNCGIHYGTY
jgi:hypothetical protein